MDGELKVWHENGALSVKAFFVDGKKHGKEETFFPNKQKRSVAKFSNDLVEGVYTEWYEDGARRYVRSYKNGLPHGDHTSYYPAENGKSQVQEKAHFVQGKPDGKHISYYSNGQMEHLLTYSNGVLDGPKSLWDEEGNALIESKYSKGRLTGHYFQKNSDGTEETCNYKNNLKEGQCQLFYSETDEQERTLLRDVHFVNDKVDGLLVEYDLQGNKQMEMTFKEGIQEGPASFYVQGKLASSGSHKAGELDGLWTYYHPNGKVARETFFNKGAKEGEEKSYHMNGEVSSISYYKNNELEGRSVHYSPEGVLVFEAEYKEGQRNGIFNKYYVDGKPRLLQTYKDDQLHGLKTMYDQAGKMTTQKFDMGTRIHD